MMMSVLEQSVAVATCRRRGIYCQRVGGEVPRGLRIWDGRRWLWCWSQERFRHAMDILADAPHERMERVFERPVLP